MPYTTPETLGERGAAVLSELCITKDFDTMSKLMSPNIEILHDDDPPLVGRDTFLAHYRKLLTKIPDFTIEILDHVAQVDQEGSGGKVWIFSRVTGLPGGKKKSSVDMLVFDAEGMLLRIKDVQRQIEG